MSDEVTEVRVIGTRDRCNALVALLRRTPALEVVSASTPAPALHEPGKVRVYLKVRGPRP